MRVFVAGATGAIGRFLVPELVRAGHDVVALVRDAARVGEVESMGAGAAVADAFDSEALTAAIVKSGPRVVIHQLTALAGVGNFKKFAEEIEPTNRLRTEVTDALIAAAGAAGATRFIAQSFCGWPYIREGGSVKTEEDPFDPDPPAQFAGALRAIRHLEDSVMHAAGLEGIVLRYGMLYGPGTTIAADGEIVRLVKMRQLPIIGGGGGVWSFVHVDDASKATVAAVSRGRAGIHNIVDDEPAPVATWLPHLAAVLGARSPRRIPAWLGRMAVGDAGVSMMTRNRGASNAKAKRELGWTLVYPTWRSGFEKGL